MVMTPTTTGSWRRLCLLLLGAGLLAVPSSGRAITLDDRGEMRFGLRAYTDVRLGTEQEGGEDDPLSFPRSAAGHLRQHRYFLELKLDHDVRRLAMTGRGIAWLFKWLDPSSLRYSLQYRGEGEGIYDYGPDEFSHQTPALQAIRLELPVIPGVTSDRLTQAAITERIHRLRRNARQRHRFFLGYLDFERGPLFIRVGRQILAWGETDQFRLLDNINPLDQGFGGFFIPLDERRVPLDMLRASYGIGQVWKLSDVFLEGFGALGNRTAINPGIPAGSPWSPGGLGFPNSTLGLTVRKNAPEDFRGGARLVFNYGDVTYTLAHYWTYLDFPGVRLRVPPIKDLVPAGPTNPIVAEQITPRVPISGGSLTFPVTSLYAVVRSELAYIQREPMNRQGRGDPALAAFPPGTPEYEKLKQLNNTHGGLDPFLYPGFFAVLPADPAVNRRYHQAIQGSLLQRDTFNWVIGLDVNRYVRWLNPAQTIFATTQLFYKHVFDSPGDLILPVPYRNIPVDPSLPFIGNGCGPVNARRPCIIRPRYFHLNDDQFLQTLLVTTSYYGGRVVPMLTLAYDWQGAFFSQPGVALVRDPFRFIVDYTRIDGAPTGQIGTLRDRDNVRLQVEYVF